MKWYAIDIETRPLPRDVVAARTKEGKWPTKPTRVEFHPPEKIGNAKKGGEAYISALPGARKKHEEAQIAAFKKYEAACDTLWEAGALHPETGQVLCIGTWDDEEGYVGYHLPEEAANLEMFWAWWVEAWGRGHQFVGHNILAFDLPYIVRRSWYLDIQVPAQLPNAFGRWPECWHDTLDRAALIRYGGDKISLDVLAHCFGLESTHPHDSAKFYELWERDRAAAIAHNRHHCEVTWKIAERMGMNQP